MHKAISYWSMEYGLQANHSIEQALVDAQRFGFTHLELAVSDVGVLTCDTHLAPVKRAIEASPVVVSSLATGMSWSQNPASDDLDMRLASIEFHQRALIMAAELGCGALLMVPGVSRSPISADLVRYDIAVERMRQMLLPLLEVAERVDVDLCLENVWNGLFYSPLELRDFIDSFDSPRLGVYLDVGNLMGIHQSPPHWIELLGERIKRVHIKDYRESFGWSGAYNFCDLGAGEVPWQATMAALKEINYDSTLTAEMLPWDACLLQRTSVAMDQIMALNSRQEAGQ
ncbi:MAG TPA: sugar phosphate isomerase/epimerase [Oceanospirillaceae bacterium]|nr:sugar phosphate isomerase/epimerase [Oceanospirillaceae bacterium]